MIAVWIVLFGVSVVATPLLEDVLTGGFADPDAPVAAGRRSHRGEVRSRARPRCVVVFKSDTLEATARSSRQPRQQALDGLTAAQIPHLESIQTYANTGSTQMISEDGKSSVAVLNFSRRPADGPG